ncbi:MAG: hypothetical protein COA84_13315 [Robiginitomaculum sp.]|nr:MAG: hypothetical protein COA84_13315 [Robiginitomaculum sp.]
MSVEKSILEESTVYESHEDDKARKAPTLAGLIGQEEPQEEWEKNWKGMPEFDQENNPAFKKLIVTFASKEDYDDFAKLIDQPLTPKTKSIWHPKPDRVPNFMMRWIEDGE